MSKFVKLLLAMLLAAFVGSALAQDEELTPTVEFTLNGGIGSQGFEWVGVGGEIDGVRNPDLNVKVGDVVRVILVKDPVDMMEHDFVIDEFGVQSDVLPAMAEEGDEVSVTFTATEAGEFEYYCSIIGHRDGGMYGNFIVEEAE